MLNVERRKRSTREPALPCCRVVLLFVLVASLSLSGLLKAQERRETADECRRKAVYICNLLLYTSWPQQAFETEDSKFVIGIFGKTTPEFERGLAFCAQKKKRGRKVRVRYLTDPADASQCHLVFVGNTLAQDVLKNVVEKTSADSTLLVGEASDFIEKGGMINLSLNGKRLEVSIDRKNSKERGLRFDARLLVLANIVD
ncbi:MAG: hypothetical protein ACI9HK_000212 [Pirellulaceae bacterium]|jgi:hypothetical protein